MRYRPRFFRLLDIFMSSSHLPSTLVASFIKRLARLSLAANPAAIVAVVPFIYNLLKRHPSCMPLIHRSSDDDEYDWSNGASSLLLLPRDDALTRTTTTTPPRRPV